MSEGKVYNLLITRGIDPDNQYEFYKERIDNQYEFYKERIDSQRDFLYNEYNTIENELTEELFEKVDVVVLLFGLFNDNKELFKELIAKSKQYNVPLLLIRFFGMEYVLKELEEISDAVVGWNPHCIVDAIETLVDGEDWVKPCDISEEE